MFLKGNGKEKKIHVAQNCSICDNGRVDVSLLCDQDLDIGWPPIIKIEGIFGGEEEEEEEEESMKWRRETYFALPLRVIVEKLGRNRQNTTN